MFNTYIQSTRSQHHHHQHHTEITEHRAPTDESVKLLREMEQAARTGLIQAIQCNTTGFSYRAIVYRDHSHFQERLRIQFTLGENQHDIEIILPGIERARTQHDYAAAVRDAIAKEIAGVLTISSMRGNYLL